MYVNMYERQTGYIRSFRLCRGVDLKISKNKISRLTVKLGIQLLQVWWNGCNEDFDGGLRRADLKAAIIEQCRVDLTCITEPQVLIHLVGQRLDGLLGRQRLQDHHDVGNLVAGHHSSLLMRADLTHLLHLLDVTSTQSSTQFSTTTFPAEQLNRPTKTFGFIWLYVKINKNPAPSAQEKPTPCPDVLLTVLVICISRFCISYCTDIFELTMI